MTSGGQDAKVIRAEDEGGQTYFLTSRLGEGGQGVVFRTRDPKMLVKLLRSMSAEEQSAWENRLRAFLRLPFHEPPLAHLPIARPKALILRPRLGYLMEMMEGLEPLSVLMQQTEESLRLGGGLSGYLEAGGLKRRFKILSRLARILAELHGQGLAYGDLSPANVFVSASAEHAEVWLIDADNVSSLSEAGLKLHTPDYGAPELLRREAGSSTFTDAWSFAVLAYRLLTLRHPLKGDVLLDGEPAAEDKALLGEAPWVDHPEDRSNASSRGLPGEMVFNKPLRALFERNFNAGLNAPAQRPSLADWAEAFAIAVGHCADCPACGQSFIFNAERLCGFCDAVQTEEAILTLREYAYTPSALLRQGLRTQIPEEELEKACWRATGNSRILGPEKIGLKDEFLGAFLKPDAPALCEVGLTPEGLWIRPAKDASIFLLRDGAQRQISQAQLLKFAERSGAWSSLHLDSSEKAHIAWRFKW